MGSFKLKQNLLNIFGTLSFVTSEGQCPSALCSIVYVLVQA